MKYVAYLLVSLLIGLAGGVFAINAGLFQGYIEQQVRAKSGVQVHLGKVQIPWTWPLTVQLGPTQVPLPDAAVEFKGLAVAVARFFEPYDIRVRVQEPKVILKGPVSEFTTAPQGTAGKSGGGPGGGRPPRFGLTLVVSSGELSAADLLITQFNLDFQQKQWMKTPARIQAAARVKSQFFPSELPVTFQTDSLAFSEESVKASGVKASFAGLNATVQGTSLLKDGRHRWVAEVKAPDLSKVPSPMELPASQWQGSVEINAELTKEGPNKPWAADGRGVFREVKARLKWKNEKMAVEGPASADIQARFTYNGGQFTIPALSGYVDLAAAQVEAHGILNKPANVPLRVDIEAAGAGDALDIKKFQARLWQFKSDLTGRVSTVAPFAAKLTLNLEPTPLKGLETILVPLKNSPVQGEAAAQGDWTGPLTDPWAAQIVVRSLRLRNFSAGVNYDTQGTLKARGPVTASLEATGEIDKGKPKSFKASGNLQLGSLALVAGPLRKEAKQPLVVTFNVRGDGAALQIDQMALSGFPGQIKVTGTVREPLKPTLNLRVDARPVDLSELRMALPDQREIIPKGTVNGHVTLAGVIAPSAPWHTWPLAVGGDLKVNLPEYRVAPAAAGPPAGPGVPPGGGDTPKITDGFLPKGELTEKLSLQVQAVVGLLVKDKLTVKGIESAGRIQKGKFAGGVTLREIFGGQVTLSELEVPLLESLPLIQGRIGVENLIIQEALEFAKPEYKTFATGRARGLSSFATRLPSDTRFMDDLKAKGQITLEPVTFNTIMIGQILNEMIKKVPVVKLPPAKVEPLKGMVKADYTLESQVVTLAPLVGRDVDGSEIDLKGKVVLSSMQADLAGNFFWVNPQIKGCLLEGNADDKGRMVVPVALKGNLMKPDIGLVSDTATRLAARALECEKKKLVDEIKKDGGKKLEQEAKKVLKGILGK